MKRGFQRPDEPESRQHGQSASAPPGKSSGVGSLPVPQRNGDGGRKSCSSPPPGSLLAMLVTLFGLTSHEAATRPMRLRSAASLTSKDRARWRLPAAVSRSAAASLHCDPSSMQFNFAGCPLGRVWRSCEVLSGNRNDWFRRRPAVANRDRERRKRAGKRALPVGAVSPEAVIIGKDRAWRRLTLVDPGYD
jgi:hypothetical protein